jgi:hypothetical protein
MTRFRVAFAALGILVVAAVVIDIAVPGVRTWANGHQLSTGLLTESVLLLGAYFIIERLIKERDQRRHSAAVQPLVTPVVVLARKTWEAFVVASAAPTDAAKEAAFQERLRQLGQNLHDSRAVMTSSPELLELYQDISVLQVALNQRAELQPDERQVRSDPAWTLELDGLVKALA